MVMPVLALKVVRDLWRAKWQYLAVGSMVLLGIAFFNASYAAYENLRDSYDTSYRRLSFEDFGISFNTAPSRTIERIRAIPGVKAAEGRLVEDLSIELPGRQTKKLVGRLISIQTTRPLRVDKLKVTQGSDLRSATAREVLLEASFAKHQGLKPGDSIDAIRGTGRARFKIVGIVQSDEYLYVVRSKQELIPLPDTFGVMFVSEDALGPLVSKPGQINEIKVTIAQPDRLETIMRQAEAALADYRPNDPVPRKDQPSSQMLEQDVEGFRMYAILFPAFFLSVAALTVYTLLMRMVHQQRPMIGLMRSLGYSNGSVIRHYMIAALLVGVLFSALGSAAGIAMAVWTSRSYMSQLQVPFEVVQPRWGLVAIGIVIGSLACLLAGYFPARVASAIRPAEAMRPVAPSSGARWSQIDRLFPSLPLLARIPLRNVFRQPRRTFSTLFGIVAGLALMITARGLLDSTEAAIGGILTGSYQYDLRVDFIKERPHTDLSTVRSWPGVVWAEGVLSVPVDMSHGNRTYSGLISGLEEGTKLTNLRDASGKPVKLSGQGAVFGQTLRKRLDLHVGDLVQLKLPEEIAKETPSPRFIRVAGFNEEAMGTQCYATLAVIGQMFRRDLELPPNAINSIAVQCDPRYLRQTRERLLDLPNAASVSSIPEMRTMIEGMLETVRGFIWIMELFGAALAFAMVFNMVTINVLERESEVATLRTIGVSRWQIARAIILENTLVSVVGIVIGLPLARLFVQAFWQAAQTEQQQELFTFKIVISSTTYLYGVIGIIVVALLSQVPSLVRISRMDLARATKERAT